MSQKKKLWAGRFSKSVDPLMERFSRSIKFDIRLLDADIRVNKAWAGALYEAGMYNKDEFTRVLNELEKFELDVNSGKKVVGESDEDVHMFVERCLTESLGLLGKQIHYGRSRNDQIATDVKIFLRQQLLEVDTTLSSLQEAAVRRAESEIDTILPGYTHLQQAQPILLSHYLLSLFFALQRDRERLGDIRKRINSMPLGSAALAGTTLNVDLEKLAQVLGFDQPADNSIDAISERDYIIDVLQLCSHIMIHLSRYSEDWIMWSSQEFGFIQMSDSFATGSSIMPQKKNPDSLELIRGKTARVIGNEMTVLTLIKGLPLTYDRDLQEDKEPLFDSLDQTLDSILVMAGVLLGMEFMRDKMAAAIDGNALATDLTDFLVKGGLAFREAHELVGKAVTLAEQKGMPISNLSLRELQTVSKRFSAGALEYLNPRRSVNSRNCIGGTSPASVKHQLLTAKKILGSE